MKRASAAKVPGGVDAAVWDAVQAVRMVDMHEHLDEESVRLKQPANLTRFFMYYSFADLACAGLPGQAQGRFFAEDISGEEQWKLIRDYWPLARNTGFCRAVRLSIRELYGIEDLADATIRPLLKAVAKANKPGQTEFILKKKCGIECCFVNASDPGDCARHTGHPGLFLFDIETSAAFNGECSFNAQEKSSGIEARTLEGWKKLVDWQLARWAPQANGLKFIHGYWRVLRHEKVAEAQAAPIFERMRAKKDSVSPAERKALEDFSFHHYLKRASDLGLPARLHTGYLSGNGYADPNMSRVRDLDNAFREYPGVKFDIFHMSYPDLADLMYMAKHYSNVYADFCWAWIIDPEACRAFARAAVEALPANKVFAFGGDFGFVDVVYGHARIAREGVARALSSAVHDGVITRADAKFLAVRWLRENAMEAFNVAAKRRAQVAGQPALLVSAG